MYFFFKLRNDACDIFLPWMIVFSMLLMILSYNKFLYFFHISIFYSLLNWVLLSLHAWVLGLLERLYASRAHVLVSYTCRILRAAGVRACLHAWHTHMLLCCPACVIMCLRASVLSNYFFYWRFTYSNHLYFTVKEIL